MLTSASSDNAVRLYWRCVLFESGFSRLKFPVLSCSPSKSVRLIFIKLFTIGSTRSRVSKWFTSFLIPWCKTCVPRMGVVILDVIFYLLQLGFHTVAVVGRLHSTKVEETIHKTIQKLYKNTDFTEQKTKIQNIKHKNYINTFTATVDLSRFNNSCLKSPASTLVDLNFQSRALRSFSLNQLRNLSL